MAVEDIEFFEVPAQISKLEKTGLFYISQIKQETCPFPNQFLLISYRVKYIPKNSFETGSFSVRDYFWKKGRVKNPTFSMLVDKEMFSVESLRERCERHFISYLRDGVTEVSYQRNFSDVFFQWITGKIIMVYPEENVSSYPRLRGIRICETHLYNVNTNAFEQTEAYVRYLYETLTGIQEGFLDNYPFEISEEYLQLSLNAITAPNTVKSFKPFYNPVKQNERIRP